MRRLYRDDLWLSADAFKMVRLMGKHAIDMADDLDVTRVFLSSLTLISAPKAGPERESFDWNNALIKMLVTFDVENKKGIAASAAKQCEPFARRLAELPLARLAPKDEEQARESLISIIDQERRRLQEMLLMLRPHPPLVLMPHVARFERVGAAVDRQHDIDNVLHRNVGGVRAVPASPAEMEPDAIPRQTLDRGVQCLNALHGEFAVGLDGRFGVDLVPVLRDRRIVEL